MKCLVLGIIAAGAALAVQPDARALVRQSIVNGEKAWERSQAYAYTKRELDKEFDPKGRVKSVDNDVYQAVPLGGGEAYEKLVSHDGHAPDADTARKQRQELKRRENETPAQRARRLAKEKSERAYMREIPDAFNFKITGEENLPTGPAWVLEATPRPGYHAKSRYAHFFPKMRGKLWIDKKDVQWVKADAEATDTVSFGFLIARLAKGSHIVLEQQRLPDGDWVPRRMMAKASARTFVFFNHRFEEDVAYSNFHRAPGLAASRAGAAGAKRPVD